jgi:hypothetical protein
MHCALDAIVGHPEDVFEIMGHMLGFPDHRHGYRQWGKQTPAMQRHLPVVQKGCACHQSGGGFSLFIVVPKQQGKFFSKKSEYAMFMLSRGSWFKITCGGRRFNADLGINYALTDWVFGGSMHPENPSDT